VPVGDLLAGVLTAPLSDHIRDVRDLHAEDERQARGLDCFWFASLTIPASAATVTSGRSLRGVERELITAGIESTTTRIRMLNSASAVTATFATPGRCAWPSISGAGAIR